MPAVTGGVFLLPFAVAVFLLDRLPPPSAADVAQRSARTVMAGRQRRAFVAHFGIGFAALLLAYFLLTAFRDFRDHYGIELLTALDLGEKKGLFVRTELWALFAVIVTLGFLSLIVDHRRALLLVYGVVGAGFAVIGLATAAFEAGWLSGFWWMAAVGVGVYLAFVPVGAVLFERMMAASRFTGTSAFAIQLADGFGYTGSVLVQILRDVAFAGHNRLAFFLPFAYVVSAAGVALTSVSAVVVLRRTRMGSPLPLG
jgi:hypothetical protein